MSKIPVSRSQIHETRKDFSQGIALYRYEVSAVKASSSIMWVDRTKDIPSDTQCENDVVHTGISEMTAVKALKEQSYKAEMKEQSRHNY